MEFQDIKTKELIVKEKALLLQPVKEKKDATKMYLTAEVKKTIFKNHGGSETNTGSAEGQVALFTHRIIHLTAHLQNNKHDYNTQRALINLVGKRRKILDYLKDTDISRYRAIVKELELRK